MLRKFSAIALIGALTITCSCSKNDNSLLDKKNQEENIKKHPDSFYALGKLIADTILDWWNDDDDECGIVVVGGGGSSNPFNQVEFNLGSPSPEGEGVASGISIGMDDDGMIILFFDEDNSTAEEETAFFDQLETGLDQDFIINNPAVLSYFELTENIVVSAGSDQNIQYLNNKPYWVLKE